MNLTFAALRAANLARQGPDGWNHRLEDWSADEWFIAVAGEVGEALNVVKKLYRDRDGLTGNSKPADALVRDLASELADAVLYLDLFMARAGDTFEQQIGDRSFAEMRSFTGLHPDESPPSLIGRKIVRALAGLYDRRGGSLLQLLDDLAFAFDIDLGAAVVDKFNGTSIKLGFPHRLPVDGG